MDWTLLLQLVDVHQTDNLGSNDDFVGSGDFTFAAQLNSALGAIPSSLAPWKIISTPL